MLLRSTVLTAALLLGACASPTPSPSPSPSSDLAGTSWAAVDIAGAPPLADKVPTLAFGADGRASGHAGCNRFSGPYSHKGAALTFGPLISTRMACLGPGDEQERRFLATLQKTTSAQVSDERLALDGPGGALAFARVRAATATCADGRKLSLEFQGEQARLSVDGGPTDVLAQQRAASGIWYASLRNELRGKGRDLTWTPSGASPVQCRQD